MHGDPWNEHGLAASPDYRVNFFRPVKPVNYLAEVMENNPVPCRFGHGDPMKTAKSEEPKRGQSKWTGQVKNLFSLPGALLPFS